MPVSCLSVMMTAWNGASGGGHRDMSFAASIHSSQLIMATLVLLVPSNRRQYASFFWACIGTGLTGMLSNNIPLMCCQRLLSLGGTRLSTNGNQLHNRTQQRW
ncbi:ORF124R [giant sea perch iridovirus - K1]|uniref:ORF124R n=1 Tax=Giant seaperch iridovirus TaxID=176655 RepID=A0A140GBA4_GSIV|nr:ORF124R [giant sea perch iridovirus - K1]